MKRITFGLALVSICAALGTAQQHSPVEKSAPQTSAQDLEQKLGGHAKLPGIDRLTRAVPNASETGF